MQNDINQLLLDVMAHGRPLLSVEDRERWMKNNSAQTNGDDDGAKNPTEKLIKIQADTNKALCELERLSKMDKGSEETEESSLAMIKLKEKLTRLKDKVDEILKLVIN